MRLGLVAAAVVAASVAALQWYVSQRVSELGFSYADGRFALAESQARELGGALTDQELASIKRMSRTEVERAFAGLRLRVSERPDAFWSVRVIPAFSARSGPGQRAGAQTLPLGVLGGKGVVDFSQLATTAIAYAPPEASRQTILDGIGRGLGRSAVHEFAHAILGVSPAMDTETDEGSYEHESFNRRVQYYGELHWAGAWPLLEREVGTVVR